LGQDYSDYTAEGDTLEEAWQNALEKIKDGLAGYFCQVWFAHPRRESQYCESELRELVQKIPGVIHLGETTNPNTGNKIDGYLWLNPKE
jgi:hypothetical protein